MNNSAEWNALTVDQKIEALHEDIMTITTRLIRLASIVRQSCSAQLTSEAKEIEKQLGALVPVHMARALSSITGFPPKCRG